MENNYKKEKMTEAERKKKISVETQNPVPSVPNRAHTEMSTASGNSAESSSRGFGDSAFYVNTDKYKSKRMSDAKRREEKE